MKKTVSVLLCVAILLSFASCASTKTVEFSYFDGNFNPFTAKSMRDVSVLKQVFDTAAVTADIGNNKVEGVLDAYTRGIGIADLEINFGYDTETDDDTATIIYHVGEGVKFSDGTPLTAMDVAFSIYVCAQPGYTGYSSLNNTYLDGLKAYQYGTDAADEVYIPFDQIKEELANPSEKTAQLLRERTILPLLRSEYDWIAHAYDDDIYEGTDMETYMKEYPDARDLFVYLYAQDQSYKAGDKTPEEVINDVADQYGTDFEALGNVYGTDLMGSAYACANQVLTEKALTEMRPNYDVNYIRGVEIIDDMTLKIFMYHANEAEIETILGVFVAPFKYYGDGCTFNGKGFDIDLDSVRAKTELIGTGQYLFSSYKNGAVTLTKNKSSYRASDSLPSKLIFKETGKSSADANNGYCVAEDNYLFVENNA